MMFFSGWRKNSAVPPLWRIGWLPREWHAPGNRLRETLIDRGQGHAECDLHRGTARRRRWSARQQWNHHASPFVLIGILGLAQQAADRDGNPRPPLPTGSLVIVPTHVVPEEAAPNA